MRALDGNGATSSERKPRWSLGSPGSTIAVAALALPSREDWVLANLRLRRARPVRDKSGPLLQQPQEQQGATTPTTMRLMRRRLLSDIGVKVTPACGLRQPERPHSGGSGGRRRQGLGRGQGGEAHLIRIVVLLRHLSLLTAVCADGMAPCVSRSRVATPEPVSELTLKTT